MTFLGSSTVVFRARMAAEEGDQMMYFPSGVMAGVLDLGTTIVCKKWPEELGVKSNSALVGRMALANWSMR